MYTRSHIMYTHIRFRAYAEANLYVVAFEKDPPKSWIGIQLDCNRVFNNYCKCYGNWRATNTKCSACNAHWNCTSYQALKA